MSCLRRILEVGLLLLPVLSAAQTCDDECVAVKRVMADEPNYFVHLKDEAGRVTFKLPDSQDCRYTLFRKNQSERVDLDCTSIDQPSAAARTKYHAFTSMLKEILNRSQWTIKKDVEPSPGENMNAFVASAGTSGAEIRLSLLDTGAPEISVEVAFLSRTLPHAALRPAMPMTRVSAGCSAECAAIKTILADEPKAFAHLRNAYGQVTMAFPESQGCDYLFNSGRPEIDCDLVVDTTLAAARARYDRLLAALAAALPKGWELKRNVRAEEDAGTGTYHLESVAKNPVTKARIFVQAFGIGEGSSSTFVQFVADAGSLGTVSH